MDPGLRLLLEVTHEAIVDAGKWYSATGVFLLVCDKIGTFLLHLNRVSIS